MYETTYNSTTISVLFALAGACVAAWAVLTICWNLREIRRGHTHASSHRHR